MRYQDAKRLNVPEREGEREMAELYGLRGGPWANPGVYKIAVTAKGETASETAQVEPDPRLPFDMDVAKAQLAQALEVRAWLTAMNESLNRMESLKAQIATAERLLAPDPAEPGTAQNASYGPVLEEAHALQSKLTAFEEKVYNLQGPKDANARLHFLARFHDRLQSLYRAVIMPYNQAPNAMVQAEMNDCRKLLDSYLAEFNELLKADVAGFNKLALEHGANTLFAGNPIELKVATSQVGGR
jgi:hypothetical protein